MGILEWCAHRTTKQTLEWLEKEGEPDEVDLQDPGYIPLTPEEKAAKRAWAQRELTSMEVLGFDNIRKQF